MSSPIDLRFLALIVHDLRNPLNVIGLTARMIEEVSPKENPELIEDFGILRENLGQIERMLNCLSDYCRQFEGAPTAATAPFDPRLLLDSLVAELRLRLAAKSGDITLEDASASPSSVTLDGGRARQALQHALANATAAAASAPIRVRASGGPKRWITEIIVDAPPGETVHAGPLHPNHFERLIGNAAERHGLELALVAAISEQLGGTARLDVDSGRCTRLVLDWPAQHDGSR
jgi:signal transduction histidine kinase